MLRTASPLPAPRTTGRWSCRRIVAALVAALVAGLLTACSGSVSTGDKRVAKSQVEKLASARLAAKTGETPKTLTCPGDLKAKVGTTMRCSLTDKADRTFGFSVTVTSVKDNVVNFDIKVDDKPTP